MSRHGAATSLAVFAMSGGIPQQLRRRHTSRIDADQQFAALRLRLRNVFLDLLWVAGRNQRDASPSFLTSLLRLTSSVDGLLCTHVKAFMLMVLL